MFTYQRAKEVFTEFCEKANVSPDIELYINPKMTSTLGRVSGETIDGITYPLYVEFSERLMKNADEESVINVIGHEAAHYIVIMRTHEYHQHDALFRSVCREIGIENDGPESSIKWDIDEKELYRYQIYCPTCKEAIPGGYQRMCKTLKEIDSFECCRCGGSGLQVRKNW